MPQAPRQTISFLTRRFREIGIQPNTRHGQNFLIDLNLQRLLVEAAELNKDDVVLEVGTGTGALTTMMARLAGHVVTVEIDAALHQLAREEAADFENVTLLHQDALRNKNNLHANVMNVVKEKLNQHPSACFKLVANLPYNIATPVISNLLAVDQPPRVMVVTIQKELAERIIASPGTKDYSALSIWVQSQCRCEIVRIMPPSVFWPKPKVYSAIIRIDADDALRAQIPDLDFFHQFVRAMFFHRRKFMRSVILSAFKGKLDKPDVDEVMAQLGHGPNSRAEQLDVPAMLALCEAIRRRLDEK